MFLPTLQILRDVWRSWVPVSKTGAVWIFWSITREPPAGVISWTCVITDALSLKSYGYLRMAQLVIPHMQKNSWGRIVNIGVGAGASPGRGNMPTSIANAMVLNTTRALSDAVAGDGIMVNVINPGVTNTERARDIHQARADKAGMSVEGLIRDVGSKLPAGRIAEPEEVARVACFFASEACSYVFGSSVYMDGGQRRATP